MSHDRHRGAAYRSERAEARWRTGETAVEGLKENFVREPGQYPFEDR